MSWSQPTTPPLYPRLPTDPYVPPPAYSPSYIPPAAVMASPTSSIIWTAAKIIGGAGILALLVRWGYSLGRKQASRELIAEAERITDERRNRLVTTEESIEEEEDDLSASPYNRQMGLAEFILSSRSAPATISPAVRLAVTRTLTYLLTGALITCGTVALLTSSSPLLNNTQLRRQLSHWQWQLLSFIGSCVGLIGVNLTRKENWLVKHSFFLLFNVASGCAVAPLFFLPSQLIGQAALMTGGVVATVSALTLLTPTRNSLYLYALPAIGASLVLTSAAHQLYLLFFPSTGALTAYDRATADTYSYLRLYGILLVFGGYVVLDMQKLIVISMAMEAERERNERRREGRGRPIGSRPVNRRARPRSEYKRDDNPLLDDDEDDNKWDNNFSSYKQSSRATTSSTVSSQQSSTISRARVNQTESKNEEFQMRRLEEKEELNENKNNDENNNNNLSFSPSENNRNNFRWLTSSAYPDYMSLSLDFYLDAFNIFLTLLELSIKREQSERERARNNNNGENSEEKSDS